MAKIENYLLLSQLLMKKWIHYYLKKGEQAMKGQAKLICPQAT